MRRIGAILACVGLTLLAGACDTTDSRYFRYGIGTDLYAPDIAETTQYQETYLAELCRQASPIISPVVAADCAATDWALLVQAGLNDIDRRCDGYLAWLDDRKRTNAAIIKQLGDSTVAAQGIMRLAGVGADPITIAGLAFGFATNTFTNINSRLLLEVDKTTIQTLVLRRRSEFRLDPVLARINHKPAAIHALRLYLTICTPFAIETDINATVTVFQVGGSAALNRPPLINADTVRAAVITRARDPLPPRDNFPPKEKFIPGFISDVQLALCVPNVDGVVGGTTLAAVKEYLQGLPRPVPNPIDVTSTALRPFLQKAISDVRDCSNAGFKTAFEVGRYGVAAVGAGTAITTLQNNMAALLLARKSTVTVQVTGRFDAQTRTAVREVRRLTGAADGDTIDLSLAAKILAGS
jgi:hypothetical protein